MSLSIKNVSKKYNGKTVLQDVDLSFSNGVYGILGANGSGKTTLMKIITTIQRPTKGKVYFNGEDIYSQGDRYRDILGYLPQNVGVYGDFTAEKFLLYMAALKGITGGKAKKRVTELLEMVGLEEQRKSKIGTFSGGMRQRVGIAQAMLNDPKVLVVDEPTAGLDPKERIRFRNLISSIASQRTVLLSTHIVSDIEYIAKEIIVIQKGSVIHQGAPKYLLETIKDKVWEVPIEREDFVELQEKYKVVNMIDRGDYLELRILSDHKPNESSKTISPTLEDLYLYYF